MCRVHEPVFLDWISAHTTHSPAVCRLSILPRFIFKSANSCGSPVTLPILSLHSSSRTRLPIRLDFPRLSKPTEPRISHQRMLSDDTKILHGFGASTYFIPPRAGFQIALAMYFRHPDTTLPFEPLKYDDVRGGRGL